MTILFDNRSGGDINASLEEIMRKSIKISLEFEELDDNFEISVSLVSGDEIKEINSRFRNIHSVTDVLSFPLLTFDEDEAVQKNEKGEILLGDIIICAGKAYEQAKEYGHSIEREFAFLTTHSMLHLFGYDHMNKKQEEIMFCKQEQILDIMGAHR